MLLTVCMLMCSSAVIAFATEEPAPQPEQTEQQQELDAYIQAVQQFVGTVTSIVIKTQRGEALSDEEQALVEQVYLKASTLFIIMGGDADIQAQVKALIGEARALFDDVLSSTSVDEAIAKVTARIDTIKEMIGGLAEELEAAMETANKVETIKNGVDKVVNAQTYQAKKEAVKELAQDEEFVGAVKEVATEIVQNAVKQVQNFVEENIVKPVKAVIETTVKTAMNIYEEIIEQIRKASKPQPEPDPTPVPLVPVG